MNDKIEQFLTTHRINGPNAATVREAITKALQCARLTEKEFQALPYEMRYTSSHAKNHIHERTDLPAIVRRDLAWLIGRAIHAVQAERPTAGRNSA
jgi:hypothetical protein